MACSERLIAIFCASCGVKKSTLLKCSRCKSVFYCSKECQKSHWKAHKQDCNQSKVLPPPKSFLQPSKKDLRSVAKFVCRHLKEHFFCVIDDLFEDEKALDILDEVKRLHSSGVFKDGQLSGGTTASDACQKFTEQKIRGDKITWLEGNETYVGSIVNLIEYVDTLVIRCGRFHEGLNGYNVEGRAKAMVACYPGNGGGYTRHVDNPDGDGRCLTVIYYLNHGWTESDGGKLRMYRNDGHIDFEPLINRLLLFWSDMRNPHEVLPAYNTRYAITIWYFDAEQRRKAKDHHLKNVIGGDLEAEFALRDLEVKKLERDLAERKLREESTKAVRDLLSEEDLDALSALVKHHPNPSEILNGLGIKPSVQEALMKLLAER